MATVKEADRTAERGQWTLKSKLLDPETLNGMRLAAKKADVPLGDWAATKLREAALVELGKAPAEPPPLPPPPARLEDVADALMRLVEERLADRLAPSAPAAPEAAPPVEYPRQPGSGDTEREARVAISRGRKGD